MVCIIPAITPDSPDARLSLVIPPTCDLNSHEMDINSPGPRVSSKTRPFLGFDTGEFISCMDSRALSSKYRVPRSSNFERYPEPGQIQVYLDALHVFLSLSDCPFRARGSV